MILAAVGNDINPGDTISATPNLLDSNSGVLVPRGGRPLPVRPVLLANPVGADDPSGVLSPSVSGITATSVNGVPVAEAPIVTSNDASVPGFPSVSLASMPGWLEWAIVAVVVFLIWHYVIRKMLKHHH